MDLQVEIQLMEQRLINVEDKLEKLETKIDSMDDKLNQVITALVGNKLTKSNGLSQDVDDIKTKVNQHEETIKKAKYFWLGVVALGSLIGIIINYIFRIFFN